MATYFFSCGNLSAGNPFVQFAIQAHAFNAQASNLSVTYQDADTALRLANTSRQLETLSQLLLCANFGTGVIRAQLVSVCETAAMFNFLSFFFLMVMGTTLMIVIPCVGWISPNLYKQHRANLVFERASKEREKKIALTASRGPPALRRNQDSSKNLLLSHSPQQAAAAPTGLTPKGMAAGDSGGSFTKEEENSGKQLLDYTFINQDMSVV